MITTRRHFATTPRLSRAPLNVALALTIDSVPGIGSRLPRQQGQ
jgi:hypothetical protein